jgi:hypothetical protein
MLGLMEGLSEVGGFRLPVYEMGGLKGSNSFKNP